MEPVTFAPLYMKRVWGGRELERVYGRKLPDAAAPFGESWEIVDREAEQSVVETGQWAGKSLHELWTRHRDEIFGSGLPEHPRFPILIKILDARDDLSIQVHPPAGTGGEPKTEMWYIADREPGAKLYAGLKRGVTRRDFERAIETGGVAKLVHALEPAAGESIFIPSGRLHAIGAGFLIHEIQQNSDTTYRVFDWNRTGLDGQPRELHVGRSLASIDFDDFEPEMDRPDGDVLATCEYFETTRKMVKKGGTLGNPRQGRFSIISVIRGEFRSDGGRDFPPGSFMLLPVSAAPLIAVTEATALQITLPG